MYFLYAARRHKMSKLKMWQDFRFCASQLFKDDRINQSTWIFVSWLSVDWRSASVCQIWHILSFPGVGYRIPRIPKWATCVRLCVTHNMYWSRHIWHKRSIVGEIWLQSGKCDEYMNPRITLCELQYFDRILVLKDNRISRFRRSVACKQRLWVYSHVPNFAMISKGGG